jgi:hypothetical protein
MKQFRFSASLLTGLFLAALTGSVCSCSSTNTHKKQYASAPPTQPANVHVLRYEPTQSTQQVGEIVLQIPPYPAQSPEDVEAKLREEGARLGADAVIVVDDRIQPEGVTLEKGWFTAFDGVTAEKIVAKAIKYETLPITGRTQ